MKPYFKILFWLSVAYLVYDIIQMLIANKRNGLEHFLFGFSITIIIVYVVLHRKKQN